MAIQQYILETTVNRNTGMFSFFLLMYVIAISHRSIETFYIPQPYHVKLYHHENMLIIGENNTKESFIFRLEASDGNEEMKQNKRLRLKVIAKRSAQESTVISEGSSYEDLNQYQATFESNGTSESVNNQSYDYDYKSFRNEYYEQEGSSGMESIRENQTYHDEYPEENKAAEINFNKTQNRSTTTANVPMENYCSVILFFRIRVIECFIYGISLKNEDITRRSQWVLVFWTVLYTITAGYLWCTKGWCFCCCPCACCHPHAVIQEAKQFLAQNPPGEAQLHSRQKVYYETSEYEKQCYKALENDVFNF